MWLFFKWVVNIFMYFMKSIDMFFFLRFYNVLCDGCSKIYSLIIVIVYISICYMLGILSVLSFTGYRI